MKRLLSSKLFKIFLLIVFIFVGYKFYLNQQKIQKVEHQLNDIKEEVRAAEVKQQELNDRVKNMEELDYIEKVARKELGLVKPGELLLIPVEEKEKKKMSK
ncbi:MAG: FtsB family cell division protein [Halothermotrichaceae bacterium]